MSFATDRDRLPGVRRPILAPDLCAGAKVGPLLAVLLLLGACAPEASAPPEGLTGQGQGLGQARGESPSEPQGSAPASAPQQDAYPGLAAAPTVPPPPEAPYPGPSAERVEEVTAQVEEALRARDLALLEELRDPAGASVYLPGGGSESWASSGGGFGAEFGATWSWPPEGGVETGDELPAGLSIAELLQDRIHPERQVQGTIMSRGWGPEGVGESIFVLTSMNDRISLGARIHAAEGFAAAAAAGDPPAKTYTLALPRSPERIQLDAPASWHASSGTLASFAPHIPHSPGGPEVRAKIDLRILDAEEETDDFTEPMDYFDEMPSSHVTETLTLPGGEPAILVFDDYEAERSTRLAVDLGEGRSLHAYCWHRGTDCDEVLRSLRVLRPE